MLFRTQCFARLFPAGLLWLTLLASDGLVLAQQSSPSPTPKDNKGSEKPPDKATPGSLTGEQIAELVILFNGSRNVLQQIRRTGLEHGRITRNNADGRTEEAVYDLRFVRGEAADKDKMRFDQQMPTLEYSLIYNTGSIFGILKGAVFKPRQEAAEEMMAQNRRGVEALLRYKENGTIVTFVAKEKQQNVDLYVIDLVDKENRTTRFYISAKLFRVSWVEYQETAPDGANISFKRRYYDYRQAQGTLVPFRSVLYRDGQQISETQILTVTYGAKIDNALFQNPEQANATP